MNLFEFQRVQKNFDGLGRFGFFRNFLRSFMHWLEISSSERFSMSMAPLPPIQASRVFCG
jgi:hypothetical protein